MEPPIVNYNGDVLTTVIWLGGVIITALVSVVIVLWNKTERQSKYIQKNDLDNRLLLKDIANEYARSGGDIGNIINYINDFAKPNITEIKSTVERIEKR